MGQSHLFFHRKNCCGREGPACVSHHISYGSSVTHQGQGVVGPKGPAEGQTLLAVGAAGCIIGRQDQSLPSRPHQKNGEIPKGAQPPYACFTRPQAGAYEANRRIAAALRPSVATFLTGEKLRASRRRRRRKTRGRGRSPRLKNRARAGDVHESRPVPQGRKSNTGLWVEPPHKPRPVSRPK